MGAYSGGFEVEGLGLVYVEASLLVTRPAAEGFKALEFMTWPWGALYYQFCTRIHRDPYGGRGAGVGASIPKRRALHGPSPLPP